ncbi:hypothetical protein GCM10019016_074010 [Streptomyces prasinosporus]|uniref:DUF2637 domain-containing protein n=1 Tax=Streptomyces prasinosporus TaxID=68256 RepID=A0ABP6TZJ0_9ACTN
MNHTPLYVRLTAALSKPLVLLSALVISMPMEIRLARSSGFTGGFEYLMPLTLSVYSAASAVIAANRPRGSKGRVSAIVGSGVALCLALSAQVVGHLIAAGYMTSGPWLVAAVSSVPALAAAHMLHLGSMPKATVPVNPLEPVQGDSEDATEEPEKAEEEPEAPTPQKVSERPSKGRSRRPNLQAIRDAAQNLDATGQKVTAKSLAAVFQVSERTGARYLSTLNAA